MFANEDVKRVVRLKLDKLLLDIKVAKTVEEHLNPGGGDAVVEVMMEELVKLHSSYGKEDACSCGEGIDCDGVEESCPCYSNEGVCDCGRKYDLPFGCALEEAKGGARIARKGWNGKGQYVFLVKDIEFHTDADLSAYEDHGIFVHDALAIKTSAEQVQVGWLASQSDMLSDDWYIVE